MAKIKKVSELHQVKPQDVKFLVKDNNGKIALCDIKDVISEMLTQIKTDDTLSKKVEELQVVLSAQDELLKKHDAKFKEVKANADAQLQAIQAVQIIQGATQIAEETKAEEPAAAKTSKKKSKASA